MSKLKSAIELATNTYILQEPQIATAIIAKYSHAVFASTGCDKNF